MQEKIDKKNRKDWINHYKKILSDGYYTIKVGHQPLQMSLYPEDREYIENQISRIEKEIENGCE